ncbi:response regulator [Croceibacterium atlanticum]|nr:response regulator [Croceibacterium atlanticum]
MGPRNCLIVDDSRVIRKVARRIVAGLGYRVEEAENGQEALAKCKVAMPDLILLDWEMPVMSGLNFVTALNGATAEKRPRILFCTTRTDTLDIHRAIEAGADDYLPKPFDEAGLLAKLKRIGAA